MHAINYDDPYVQERIFRDLETYWYPEEKEQFKDAPDEWVIECYKDSDLARFGPNIRKVLNLVDQLGEVRSEPYIKMLTELNKHRAYLKNASNPKSDFIRITMGDLITIEEVLRGHGYESCWKYIVEDLLLEETNLLADLGYSSFLKALLLCVQAQHLVDEFSDGTNNYYISSDLYSDVTMILRDCGFKF